MANPYLKAHHTQARAGQEELAEERGEMKVKGPQSMAEILSGPIPKDARRLLVKHAMYLGDVRLKIFPGDFVDIIPGQHWRHQGVGYQKYASLKIAIDQKIIVPYNPRDPEHQSIIDQGPTLDGGEREPSMEEMAELIADAPTIEDLENGGGVKEPEERPVQAKRAVSEKPQIGGLNVRPAQQRKASPIKSTLPTHAEQAQMSDSVCVGMDARGARKIQEYDPSKENRPGTERGYESDPEDNAEQEARDAERENSPRKAAVMSKPEIRGRNAAQVILQNNRMKATKDASHKRIVDRQMEEEREMLQAEGADVHGNFPVSSRGEQIIVASIQDPPEPQGLKNVPAGKTTQTVGYKPTRPTEVIRDGVRKMPAGFKGKPIKMR